MEYSGIKSIDWLVSIIQTGHYYRNMVAPVSGASASSGALFRTNRRETRPNHLRTPKTNRGNSK